MIRNRLKSLSFVIILFTSLPMLIPKAAPDPVMVENAKAKAQLHLVGAVVSDELYEDLTIRKENPLQIRKMTLEIREIHKSPSARFIKTIDVYYQYVPLWMSYSGAERVDIAVGDIVEIWLKSGPYGWEPAYSGETINHIKYVDKRPEWIKEPFWHWMKRVSRKFWTMHSASVVFWGIVISLSIIVLISHRKLKRGTLGQ